MKLLLATSNLHKLREIRAILTKYKNLELLSLRDFPNFVLPEETGQTFEENAILKASSAAKELKVMTLADDSGLVVPALDGRPGIRSRRYAGKNATNKENLEKIIGELKNIKPEKRLARFECAMALCDESGNLIKCVTGTCEGSLITEPRGNQGFGYDPIFIKYDYNKTIAELTEDVKNRISHRSKAFDKILLTLESIGIPC
ncbi:MAG: RdgB/HAM1 family non-canonical purine NTP pyrophosphatase [Candidatus Algichlamydia australiensis]|nr:RdgB/HAM1 family non-canonical purine NTP pyrophosphatase [Chlamydiales bacterium]